MPGIFKDSSAPYVLVLLISLVGWMFNSALENAKNLRIIEYWTEYGKDGAADTVTFHVINRSMAQAVNSGKFNFICIVNSKAAQAVADPGCLIDIPSVGAKAQYLGGADFSLPEPVQANGKSAVTDARIPPGNEIAYRFGLRDSNSKLRFRYLLDDSDVAGDKSGLQIKIVNKDAAGRGVISTFVEGLTVFIISNYLLCLVFVMFLFLLMIAVYFIFSLVALVLGSKAKRPAEPSKLTLQLTLNGESYVATLERS